MDPTWLIETGARRQKWINQAQSLNLYFQGTSSKKLDETYKLDWLRSLKVTYYLRCIVTTAAEKSTGKGGELNAVSAHGIPPLPEAELSAKTAICVRVKLALGTVRRVSKGKRGFCLKTGRLINQQTPLSL